MNVSYQIIHVVEGHVMTKKVVMSVNAILVEEVMVKVTMVVNAYYHQRQWQ
jgi:hypothetical protein